MNYTKGKWVKDYGRTIGHIKAVGSNHPSTPTVCRYDGGGLIADSITLEEREANAYLIAAAPDMYEVCKHTIVALVNRLDDTDNLTQQEELLLVEARQVISKAESK